MTHSPLPHVPLSEADAHTAAWLKRHLQADPELASLFLSAAATDWSPVVDFVAWALERRLLGNLRTSQFRRTGRARR